MEYTYSQNTFTITAFAFWEKSILKIVFMLIEDFSKLLEKLSIIYIEIFMKFT